MAIVPPRGRNVDRQSPPNRRNEETCVFARPFSFFFSFLRSQTNSATIVPEESTGKEEGSPRESGEMELDPEELWKRRLIKAVHKRRALWDTSFPEYPPNRLLKDQLWWQVAEHLEGEGWSQKTDQQEVVKRTKKTWKNMKDCYFRDVKKLLSGDKGRRYRYFQRLEYLRPHVAKKSKNKASRAAKRNLDKGEAGKSTPGTSDCKGSGRSSKRARTELTSNQTSSGASSSKRDATSSKQPSDDVGYCQKKSVRSSTREEEPSKPPSDDAGSCQKKSVRSSKREDAPSTPPSDDVGSCQQEDVRSSTREDAPSKQPNDDSGSYQKKDAHTSTRVGAPSKQRSDDAGSYQKKDASTSTREDAPSRQPSGDLASPLLPLDLLQLKMTQEKLLRAKLREENRMDREPDGDRDFASSLVPMLRRLDDDKKTLAKIKILEVFLDKKYLVPEAVVDLPDEKATTKGRLVCMSSFEESPSPTFVSHTSQLDHDESGSSSDEC